jgi:DNA-binding transcriptional regulator YdaS (Cro superfamily)
MDIETLTTLTGSKATLAALLGLSRAAVAAWGKDIPPVRQEQIKTVFRSALCDYMLKHEIKGGGQ